MAKIFPPFGVALLIGAWECLCLALVYVTIAWPIPALLDWNLRKRTPLVGSWDLLVVEEEEEKGVLLLLSGERAVNVS